MPCRRAGGEQATRRSHVDEASDRRSEPAGERPRELDLESACQDHVATLDDTRLQRRVTEAESDDQRPGLLRRR